MTELHPTSATLLQTTIDLLGDVAPTDITLGVVLGRSGISKGSMYHHYRDFDDLMDRALVTRFSALVDRSIDEVERAISGSTDAEECYAALVELVRVTERRSAADLRARRIWTLAQAGVRESMRRELGAEQQRLTDAVTESFLVAQGLGWFSGQLDARALAVLVQACTVGRVVDDIVERPADPGAWEQLLATVLRLVVMAPLVAGAYPASPGDPTTDVGH